MSRASRGQLAGAAAIAGALDAGVPVRLLLAREGELSAPAHAVLARCEATGIPVRRAGAREVRRLAAHGEPELLALVGPSPTDSLEEVLAMGGALWLLSGVGYPGNAGFVIRTVEVSGAAGIVIDADFDHTARRQALRVAMRADRFFPVLWARAEDVLARAREAGHRLVGIEDRGTRVPWEEDLTRPSVFLVGGEAGGVPEALLGRCDVVLRIPMTGFVPSYNLQAAVAMVAGERLRQLGPPEPGPGHQAPP